MSKVENRAELRTLLAVHVSAGLQTEDTCEVDWRPGRYQSAVLLGYNSLRFPYLSKIRSAGIRRQVDPTSFFAPLAYLHTIRAH